MKNIYAPAQISLDLRRRMKLSYIYIYTLREYIELYRKRSTTVFVTFLDASKAFDRLDHWLLFKKIIKRKVLLFIDCVVFAPKDAYKIGKHFFYIFLCVKWCETGWYYISCSI